MSLAALRAIVHRALLPCFYLLLRRCLLSDFKRYDGVFMQADYLSSLVRDFSKTKVPVRPGRALPAMGTMDDLDTHRQV